jgi:SAM-dependent methyltransferase
MGRQKLLNALMREAEELTSNEAFTVIAPYYDELMAEVPYSYWVDYIHRITKCLGHSFKTVLDLACGTGNVAIEFAKRSYSVVGVDKSEAMIKEAMRKAMMHPELKLEFYCQDITELLLPMQFDLAVCLFDSLNYIIEPSALKKAFKATYNVLKPKCYFIFDMNSEYALSANLFTQDNLDSDDRLKYLWISSYDSKTKLCRVDMYFQIQLEDGRILRFKEVHYQRAYDVDEVITYLLDAGFECEHVFEAYTFRAPTNRSTRIYYVAKRL